MTYSGGGLTVNDESAELERIHNPHVASLADAGDWAALCRYWIALRHRPALDRAVTVAEWREGSREAALPRFLQEVQRDPSDFKRRAPALDAAAYSVVENETISALVFYPYVALCEQAVQFAVEERDEALRFGITATQRALNLPTVRDDPALSAFLLTIQGHGYLNASQPVPAEEALQTAVRLHRDLADQAPDRYHAVLAVTLTSYGRALRELGNHRAAADAFREALGIRRTLAERWPNTFRSSLALTLNNLGSTLRDLRELHEAVAVLREADVLNAELARQRPDTSRPDVARTKRILGSVLHDLLDFTGAVVAFQEAERGYRLLVEGEPDTYRFELSETLNRLAAALKDLGESEAAMERLQEAAVIRRDLAQRQPAVFLPELAESLARLAAAHCDLGDLNGALKLLLEAEAIRRKLALQFPATHGASLCRTLQDLGIVLRGLGDSEQGLVVTREAVVIRRELARTRPDVHLPELAGLLGNLAIALRHHGEPEEAANVLREAERIRRELVRTEPGAHLPGLATTLANLGAVLFPNLGDAAGSAAAMQEAADLFRNLAQKRPDIYQPDFAWALNNLGADFHALGRHKEALVALREAELLYRDLSKQRPRDFREGLAGTLGNIAGILGAHGDHAGAEAAFREILNIHRDLARQQPAAYSPILAQTLGNLGIALAAQRMSAEAMRAFREAESLYDALEARNPSGFLSERVRMLTSMGLWLLLDDGVTGSGDPYAAREAFRKVRRLAERHRGQFRNRNPRRRILQESMVAYLQLVELCLVLGSNEDGVESWAEAAEVAEASRARALSELLAEEELTPANTPADLVGSFRALRRNFLDASLRLEMEREQQAQAQVRPPELGRKPATNTSSDTRSPQLVNALHRTPSADRLAFLTAEVDRLAAEHATVLEQIRGYDAGFDPDQPVPPISFSAMQQVIPTDRPTVVVTYALNVNGGAAILMTREGIGAVELPDLSLDRVSELADQWNQTYRRASPEEWRAELPKQLAPMTHAAILPLLDHLKGFDRVIFIPSGAMHLFPLHAAALPGGTYLADHIEVGYAPSLSVLDRCRNRVRPAPARLLTATVPHSIRDQSLNFAEPEAAVIGSYFVDISEKRGRDVTRQWLLDEAGSHDVVHYTGHSHFRPADPLLSGLVLRSGRTPNEWLTLRDVYCGLHLQRTTLVVLSGCESGVVVPDQLDEYVGLPLGLLYAGATCVLGSLWEVSDPVTMLTMDRFYATWQGGRTRVGIGAALAATQAWLRAIPSGPHLRELILAEDFQQRLGTDRNRNLCRAWVNHLAQQYPETPPFASPVYWAAFAVTGLG